LEGRSLDPRRELIRLSMPVFDDPESSWPMMPMAVSDAPSDGGHPGPATWDLPDRGLLERRVMRPLAVVDVAAGYPKRPRVLDGDLNVLRLPLPTRFLAN
jgi:hypothetical protein